MGSQLTPEHRFVNARRLKWDPTTEGGGLLRIGAYPLLGRLVELAAAPTELAGGGDLLRTGAQARLRRLLLALTLAQRLF